MICRSNLTNLEVALTTSIRTEREGWPRMSSSHVLYHWAIQLERIDRYETGTRFMAKQRRPNVTSAYEIKFCMLSGRH